MKKLRNKWFLPLFCAALLATGACSEDDTESGTREPLPPTLTTENIPDGGFSFLYSAQEPQTFLLSTDAPWEITKTSGWFVVSPKEGEAGQGIEITVLADQNEGEERTGEFTIRANSGNNLHPVYTEYTVELRQDAFRAAGITVEGLTEDVLTFAAEESAATTLYVTASYDWNITLSDDSWVGISPMNGTASERTAVKVTPKPSTDGKRHEATMTITATDPIYPENTATREIALVQMLPSDSHPEETVFWQDDFGWVTENWVERYTKYGWPSVAIDGKNNNEFALSTDGMASAAAEKGYTYSPSVYARYEGHLKLGKTANMGSITTPSLSDIDAGKNATLLVQFDAAAYSSAGGSVDNGDTHFYVSVTPPATIGGMEESEVGIEVTNVWSWTRYSVLVYGATAETKITFGSERAVKCRLYLDNISISRAADEGAETPEPQPVETPLDKEIVDNSPAGTYNSSNEVSKDGATLLYSVRVNKAWSAESDCDWLTITAVRCGSTGTGANNGASLSGGIATVSATGLPYNQTLFAAAENKTTEARTGHILIKVNGETIETVTVKQEAGAPASFDIQGLNDNAVTLASDPASSEASVTFTVTGTHDWTASVPSGETWYTVSPLEGAAGQAVEVTVSAAEKNEGAARNGSFTLTMTPEGLEPVTETITVTQNSPEVMWDLSAPVQWNFSAENMPNYQDFFGFPSQAGFMRLYGHVLSEGFVNFWEVPNLLLQKFPAEEFTATAKVKVAAKDEGQASGLIVMGWDYCRLAVEKEGGGFVLKQALCHDAEQGSPEASRTVASLPASRKYEAGLRPNYELDLYLRVEVGKGALCRFSYSTDGREFHPAGEPFKARQGTWIGAKVGFFSTAPCGKERGWMDIDWFRVE